MGEREEREREKGGERSRGRRERDEDGRRGGGIEGEEGWKKE